ncbi:MAG: alpha/beta hydrolase [Archangium sp.]
MLALLASVVLASTSCPAGAPLAGGNHSEVVTTQGRVHLWCRSGEVTSVVLYVHGYRDSLDSAFVEHHLAEQFAATGLEALFVVVEAPSGPREGVVVGDLDALLLELGPVPERTVLVGHSGGNRTLKQWLRSERAREVVLLDGMYGSTKEWSEWLARTPDARLSLVSQHTAPQASRFVAALPRALRARVSDAPAKCSHMEIVTGGKWLKATLVAG